MPIGPEIPPHLLNRTQSGASDDEDDGPQPAPPANIGPQIPIHLSSATSRESKTLVYDDDDDDVGPRPASGPSTGPSIGPSLPSRPQSTAPTKRAPDTRPVAGPSMPPPAPPTHGGGKRAIGPTMPSYAPTYDPTSGYGDESDSDDDVGPKPLPAGMHHEAVDPVKEFMEREEKRRKLAEVSLVAMSCWGVYTHSCVCVGSSEAQDGEAGRMDAGSAYVIEPSRKCVSTTTVDYICLYLCWNLHRS
jgi:hypothetical protein